MPTEEVFTTPHKTKVNGTLKATKVLSVHGKLVDDFGFVFKDGKVVDYFAAKGKDVLEHLLETDEGAKFLGEVALVPFDSPISNTGILFNHTLFDENASIHFALGRAFPYAMVDGPNLSEEELLQRGANYSIVHTDFMVGSDKMSVTGYEKDGKKTEIFRNGNWSIT
jgi:aminopeptidase